MTGLLLIGIAVVWVVVTALLATFAAGRVKTKSLGVTIWILVFTLLLPLPLIDEIVGGFQFRALCREGAVMRYEDDKLRGKTVRMRQEPHPDVPSVMQTPTRRVRAAIPIEERTVDWLDVETKEVLLSYKAYTTKGGLLIRTLGISNADSPLTIDPPSCAANEVPVFERLGVKFR